MSIFGIDWLNKAKKKPMHWGWILNSQQYTNDFFGKTDNISVASAINAIGNDTTDNNEQTVETGNNNEQNVLGSDTVVEKKEEVGDMPTETQITNVANNTATVNNHLPDGVDKPKPADFLAQIQQGKQLKKVENAQNVNNHLPDGVDKPKPAGFLAQLKQGKKPSQIKPHKHVKLLPPTPPPQALGKMNMEDAIQHKMSHFGQFTSKASPEPSVPAS